MHVDPRQSGAGIERCKDALQHSNVVAGDIIGVDLEGQPGHVLPND